MQGPPGPPQMTYRPPSTQTSQPSMQSGPPKPGQTAPSWQTATPSGGGPTPQHQYSQQQQPPTGMLQQMKLNGPPAGGPRPPPGAQTPMQPRPGMMMPMQTPGAQQQPRPQQAMQPPTSAVRPQQPPSTFPNGNGYPGAATPIQPQQQQPQYRPPGTMTQQQQPGGVRPPAVVGAQPSMPGSVPPQQQRPTTMAGAPPGVRPIITNAPRPGGMPYSTGASPRSTPGGANSGNIMSQPSSARSTGSGTGSAVGGFGGSNGRPTTMMPPPGVRPPNPQQQQQQQPGPTPLGMRPMQLPPPAMTSSNVMNTPITTTTTSTSYMGSIRPGGPVVGATPTTVRPHTSFGVVGGGGMPQPGMPHLQQQQQIRPSASTPGYAPPPSLQQQMRPPPVMGQMGGGMPNSMPPPGTPSVATPFSPTMQQPPQQPGAWQQQQQPPLTPGPRPPAFGGGVGMNPMNSNAPPPPPGGIVANTQQQQQPGPQSMSRSIDPGQMPRPASTQHPMQVFETRRENTHNIPPPAEEPLAVRDTGSAGPRHMRSTLNAIPAGADLLKAISLPFVIVVNPLAMTQGTDSPIEVVDTTSSGPIRCKECKAYINPYMKVLDNGRRMQCCFCNAYTELAPDAFTVPHVWQDTTANPALRPELNRGSIEFIVSGEYMVRPPAPPTYVFVVDVSQPAIASGATAAVCASLTKLLDELPGGDRTRVGIITFDTSVHFYALKPNGDRPRMFIMSDVDDPYNPLGPRAVVNVSQCKDQLVTLLTSIPTLFAGNAIPENCGGAAIAAAIATMKADVGGRAILFLSSIPHKGAYALKPREAGRPPSERDVLDIMVPQTQVYSSLADDAAENQISIDIVAVSQGYVDLATLSVLSTTTCGNILRHTPFVPSADAATLHNDLRWSLIRPQGLEAVGRLRVSTGMSVEKYVGAFYKRNTTDINFAAIHCESAVAARVVHDERLAEGSEVYTQFALLYSTTDGQRRVRVHTLALPVTRSTGSAFRAADMDAYLTYVTRKVSSQIPGRSLVACREAVTKAAVETLLAYRKQCASASSSGQLILPEALKLLPIYALALTKLPCFRTDARADNRAMWMARLLSLPADRAVSIVHPRLLAFHEWINSIASQPEAAVTMPNKLWLSAEKLDPTGVYLHENGFEAYMYVGASIPPELCMALFNVPSVETVSAATVPTLPVLDNPVNKAAHKALDYVRQQRCRYMRLRIVKRGDPAEAAFLAALVEDRSPSAGMSYVEFLCHLHRQIQNKL